MEITREEGMFIYNHRPFVCYIDRRCEYCGAGLADHYCWLMDKLKTKKLIHEDSPLLCCNCYNRGLQDMFYDIVNNTFKVFSWYETMHDNLTHLKYENDEGIEYEIVYKTCTKWLRKLIKILTGVKT